MFRVTFLADDPAERERLATGLRTLSMGGDARIVAAFADAKSVEVYLDIAESAVPRAVHPDGRTLSVQARHRRHETVESVEVEQTDDAVALTVLVGTADDDVRSQYVSLAVAFTWIDTFLDRPVGDRRIIRYDPD